MTCAPLPRRWSASPPLSELHSVAPRHRQRHLLPSEKDAAMRAMLHACYAPRATLLREADAA
jgi:hypothetical protein